MCYRMAKIPRIKWRDKDARQLERIVTSFNRRVKRVKDNFPERAEFLPKPISASEFKARILGSREFEKTGGEIQKNTILSRKDLNRELNSLKRFNQKTSELVTTEQGLTLTRYAKREADILRRAVNLQRQKEVERLDLSPEKGTATEIEKASLKPKPVFKGKSKKEFEAFIKSAQRELLTSFKEFGLEQYKENYLKGVENGLGDDGKEIIKKKKNASPEFIFENSKANPFLSIGFNYDPLPDADKASEIFLQWQSILDE